MVTGVEEKEWVVTGVEEKEWVVTGVEEKEWVVTHLHCHILHTLITYSVILHKSQYSCAQM